MKKKLQNYWQKDLRNVFYLVHLPSSMSEYMALCQIVPVRRNSACGFRKNKKQTMLLGQRGTKYLTQPDVKHKVCNL